MQGQRGWAGRAALKKMVDRSAIPPGVGAIVFLLAHAGLGVLVVKVSIAASIHAYLTILIGFWWAVTPGRKLHEVAMVAAYITGAEVLWRMANDSLFYEMAKYSVTAMFVVALVRDHGLKSLVKPALCFALLLPSAFVAISFQPWDVTRNQLSFNLSGPLALAVCAGFFATVRLSPGHVQRMFVAGVAPVVGIGANVLYGIITNPSLQMFNGSNKYLSGLWSPNQVAAALCLGATFAFLFLIDKTIKWELRLTMMAMMIWLFFQGVLTFSRGGPVCAAGAAVGFLICLARDPRTLGKTLGAVAVVGVLGYFVIWPRLDQFTAGGLSARFQDTGTTGRDDIAWMDLEIFAKHPLLGVGPGRAQFEHPLGLAAHTEFTRLPAEHGIFGCAWLVVMAVTTFANFKRGGSPYERGFAVAMMVWSLLFMANSAMRLVAPCLTFGLGFATLLPAEDAEAVPAPAPVRRHGRRLLLAQS